MVNETSGEKTIEELKKELEKIDLQQKIAVAKKATLKAKLPDSEVKALEGKLTVDENVTIECQILTYKAMSEIASQISREIKNQGAKRVIIFNQNDLNIVLSYKTILEQTNLFKKQYEEAMKEEKEKKVAEKMLPVPTDILVAGTTVLKSFVDIASLFRTDTDIKGNKIDIVDEALVSEIARTLQPEVTIIYPPFINIVPDKLLSAIFELSKLKEEADRKIAIWSKGEQFQDKVAQLKNLNGQYEKVLTSLVGVDEKTGISRLEKLIKGEILSTELDKNGTDILYLKVVAGGGNNKATRNLLWSRFFHSGGAIITYFLLNKDGVIKASKTFYNTTGYKQFKNSGSIVDLNNFYNQ
jgi:hypothetical protein